MPRSTAVFALLAAFLALGGLSYRLEFAGVRQDRLRAIYDTRRIGSGEPVDLEGVLLGWPEPAYNGVFLRLAANTIVYKSVASAVSGNVRIFVPLEGAQPSADFAQLELRSGTRIKVTCAPEREERFQNPGVRPRIALLDEQQIDAVATLKSPLQIEKIGQSASFSFADRIFTLRLRLIEEFRRRFETRTAGVLIASLLGDKYFLDKQTADLFREGGIFHILVISGMHITFIGGLVLVIVAALTRNRLLQFLIVSLILWAYTIAVGAEVPVARASVVFTILLFSRVIYRSGSLLNSLGACALLLLAFRPSSVFTPSFQLTFLSVGAIIAIAFPLIANLRKIGRWMPTAADPIPPDVPVRLRRFCETLYWRRELWDFESRRQIWSGNLCKRPYCFVRGGEILQKTAAYLFEALVVSLIVQICLLPVTVFYFHRVSLAGVVLNLWVSAALALESFASLAAVLLAQISDTLALPLAKLAELLNWLLLVFPKMAVAAGAASVRVPVYPGYGRVLYLLYFVGLAAAAAAVFRWNPSDRGSSYRLSSAAVPGLLTALFGTIILLHPFSSPAPDGRLRIDFLDVGQGDSALVTFPDGETMLIDGGGRTDFRDDKTASATAGFEADVPRIGEAVVSEFLWEKGYSQVDYLVATHADFDHIQGLSDIAANFDIGTVFLGRTPTDDADYLALAGVLRRKNILAQIVTAGDVLRVGDVRVEVLNPGSGDVSSNENSVVTRIIFGNRAFLLTGDIGKTAEAALSPLPLRADVVKVPHHGSRNSSSVDFIKSTGAAFAVASVGRRSPFGHPHAETVERWENAGVRFITTGENGTITFTTDGDRIFMDTFVK